MAENLRLKERCKGVHYVDLGESFPTSIYLQKLASIQPRTSLVKFARSPSTDPPGPRDPIFPLPAKLRERQHARVSIRDRLIRHYFPLGLRLSRHSPVVTQNGSLMNLFNKFHEITKLVHIHQVHQNLSLLIKNAPFFIAIHHYSPTEFDACVHII